MTEKQEKTTQVVATETKVFTFNPSNQPIRVETIGGEPWFVAKDVCDALSLTDVSMTMSRLDDDEKLTQTLLVSGQGRQMWLVNESGLYNLIFQSRKAEAKKFRKWVTGEVLPSIRKTGRYAIAAFRAKGEARCPRERGAELGFFYRELGKWVLRFDVETVAAMRGVRVKSVLDVLRGRSAGYETLALLVDAAASNRRAGLGSDLAVRGSSTAAVRRLALEFMGGGDAAVDAAVLEFGDPGKEVEDGTV